MRQASKLILFGIMSFLLGCFCSFANAQDSIAFQKATEYFSSGYFYFKQTQYANAVTSFESSNRAVPAAVTWYFLGLCYNQQKKATQSHPAQVVDANNAIYAMNQALQSKDPPLAQKFISDARYISSENQDFLDGKKYYVSGDALTHLPAVPAITDNPNTAKAYRIPNNRIFLPQDGTPNNGSTIGDFCCDGYTATVLRNDNQVLGYIFFYAREAPAEAATPKLRILISAAAGIADLAPRRKFDEIVFDVQRELYPNAFKKKMVGGFTYEVTILNVTKPTPGTFSNLRIQVDIK